MKKNECCANSVKASLNCISECSKSGCDSCTRYCQDVVDLCSLSIQLEERNSNYAEQIRKLCAEVCAKCADHCGNCESECCKKCAEACRACAEQCGA